MPKYPDCFPADLEKRVIEEKHASFSVRENSYRILRCGVLDRDAFLSTFEDQEKRGVRKPDRHPTLSSYSTSCFNNIDGAANILNFSFRNEPRASIAVGTIFPQCGPSTDPNQNGHIDWWIYEDASPEKDFKEVS